MKDTAREVAKVYGTGVFSSASVSLGFQDYDQLTRCCGVI